MNKKRIINYVGIALMMLTYTACKLPASLMPRKENKVVPATYTGAKDTLNTARTKWKAFFNDPNLDGLINDALTNNQELNILLQDINIAKSGVRGRKGAYLPYVGVGAGAGLEKVGRYTSQGASDATTDIMPGKSFPDPLPNYLVGVNLSWEVDIWKKLRNSKNAAVVRYLSSVEGKNYMVTRLIAEIANSYYELMALDNQLEILKRISSSTRTRLK